MHEVRALAPATVSNVVCGFDCLGFALDEPLDETVVRQIANPEVRIIHHDDFGLPTEPDKNVVGIAVLAMIRDADLDFGFEVEITKGIKPGSGIGSSAASSCGAVVAANRLLGDRYSKLELVEFVMQGEMLASGARHADNVAPCIFGGMTLVRSTEPIDIVTLAHPSIFATVIHPQIEIKTSDARAVLPQSVPLIDATRQWANLGAFVAAASQGDLRLLGRSMEDVVVEPARKALIPKFDEVKEASLAVGALGGGISGSGPSMFMLCPDAETASKVREAMRLVYEPTGIDFKIYCSPIAGSGARVI
jgi:homoserine kinase